MFLHQVALSDCSVPGGKHLETLIGVCGIISSVNAYLSTSIDDPFLVHALVHVFH